MALPLASVKLSLLSCTPVVVTFTSGPKTHKLCLNHVYVLSQSIRTCTTRRSSPLPLEDINVSVIYTILYLLILRIDQKEKHLKILPHRIKFILFCIAVDENAT